MMNREVDDPRGWITLDWDKRREEERTGSRSCYPFAFLSEEGLGSRLYPVTAETAVRLLVEMTHSNGGRSERRNRPGRHSLTPESCSTGTETESPATATSP